MVIICSKGIEIDTKLFPSDIIKSVFNTSKISILSGPNFSVEITQNLPTAATLATKDRKVFDDINLTKLQSININDIQENNWVSFSDPSTINQPEDRKSLFKNKTISDYKNITTNQIKTRLIVLFLLHNRQLITVLGTQREPRLIYNHQQQN